ncbi:helix-turn-helix domain-containing protein [Chitinophaga sp. 22536]|uniref:helix-turn-helix domain-containing protein n=1 Tax=unclassified Chitinophaga TaxID=2619133 RepID=UPI003F87CD88
MDIEKLIESGSIMNELDYERAMIADRKLRLLAKTNPHFKNLRNKLGNLIEEYEARVWSDENAVGRELIAQSEQAELIAEKERIFLEKRRKIIQSKLKSFNLTQAELGMLLGHKSKTHMSELITGLKPFTLQDLVIISKIFKIDIDSLVPKYLPIEKIDRISATIEVINNPKLNRIKPVLLFAS